MSYLREERVSRNWMRLESLGWEYMLFLRPSCSFIYSSWEFKLFVHVWGLSLWAIGFWMKGVLSKWLDNEVHLVPVSCHWWLTQFPTCPLPQLLLVVETRNWVRVLEWFNRERWEKYEIQGVFSMFELDSDWSHDLFNDKWSFSFWGWLLVWIGEFQIWNLWILGRLCLSSWTQNSLQCAFLLLLLLPLCVKPWHFLGVLEAVWVILLYWSAWF